MCCLKPGVPCLWRRSVKRLEQVWTGCRGCWLPALAFSCSLRTGKMNVVSTHLHVHINCSSYHHWPQIHVNMLLNTGQKRMIWVCVLLLQMFLKQSVFQTLYNNSLWSTTYTISACFFRFLYTPCRLPTEIAGYNSPVSQWIILHSMELENIDTLSHSTPRFSTSLATLQITQ